MKIRKLGRKGWLALCICIAIFIWWTEPSKWFSSVTDVSVSPQGFYRLEFHSTFYSLDRGFVRLYDNKTEKLIDESPVVWLSGNAWETWPRDASESPEIRVGISISFPALPEAELIKRGQMTFPSTTR
jgi:hypothetical protein